MFQIRKVDSFELPELQPYRTMRLQVEHQQQGIFVAEGEKVVRRLLESSFGVISVLLPEAWLRELEGVLDRRSEMIQVFVAEKKLLETLTGFSMYQGLLAVGRIPARLKLEELLDGSAKPWLLVAVDGLSDAQNLGAIVRNCAAFGVGTLVVGETSCSPFLRRAVRSSMGTVFELPVLEVENLAATVTDFRRRGIRTIAAHPHVAGPTLAQADLKDDCCLILGSEGFGISQSVLAACEQAVAIPMAHQIDSLNVVSAAAVFLYEANRQRGRM